jgi:hypothetical protein
MARQYVDIKIHEPALPNVDEKNNLHRKPFYPVKTKRLHGHSSQQSANI